jgi:hypothetical protein
VCSSDLLITVKPAKYLAIEGRGEPGGAEFQAKIGALYGMAFTIKMARKFAGRDYKVCGLEGLWWCDRHPEAFFPDIPKVPRGEWRWKLLIRAPDFINEKDRQAALAALRKRGKGEGADQVLLETIDEGRCVQVLHVGPYGEEPRTLQRAMEFMAASGLRLRGHHHEIYLNDPRRVPAARLKTILRHPVE